MIDRVTLRLRGKDAIGDFARFLRKHYFSSSQADVMIKETREFVLQRK